jgi:hypothetical protein
MKQQVILRARVEFRSHFAHFTGQWEMKENNPG